MNLENLLIRFFTSRFLVFGMAAVSLFLLLSQIPHELADLKPMRNASELMTAGGNPYLANQHIGMGPLALELLGSILSNIPVTYIPISWQILNLLGFGVFMSAYSSNATLQQKISLFSLIIWLAPLRETLINNQLNGIALGFIGLARIFILRARQKYSVINSFVCLLALTLAIELKISITIIFFVVIIREIPRESFKTTFKFIITPCLLLIYYFLSNIGFYRSWILRLWEFSNSDPVGNETSSIYFIFAQFPAIPFHEIILLAFGLILLIGIFYQRQYSPWIPTLIAAVSPSVLNYVHYLDLSAASILLVAYTFTHQKPNLIYVLLLGLVPIELLNPKNFLFLAVFLTVFVIVRKVVFNEYTRSRKLILGILAYSITTTFVNFSSDSIKIRTSLVMIQIIVLVCIAIYCEIKAQKQNE